MGTKMPRLAKPRIAQVIDGKEVIDKTFARIRTAAYEVLASDFRRKVDLVNAREPKK